jgi:hypothetical protein
MYYGQHGNASLVRMFNGDSSNISMEEIYGVDYSSSVYHFTIQTSRRSANSTTIIEVTLKSLNGLDGSWPLPSGLLGLSLLSSTEELCATFFFLWDSGVKENHLSISLYADPNRIVSMKGFMSLPHQARSFDHFQLFENYHLRDNKRTSMDFSVYSLKFLQKRNTAAEPCIDVDNYDKVYKHLFLLFRFSLCS